MCAFGCGSFSGAPVALICAVRRYAHVPDVRGLLIGGRRWWTDARGWTPAYPQVLCQPPPSGAVPCRKGRSVQVHVVGRLPTPRFCANLHLLGLCRAERGGWYGCTWLTGLRLSSCEPRVARKGRSVQVHVVGRLPTPRLCANLHLLGLCRAERGGRYRCTWLDACLPPGFVPTGLLIGAQIAGR